MTHVRTQTRYVVTRSNTVEGYQIWDRKLKGHIGSKSGHLLIWKTRQGAIKHIPKLPK